jgi:hypothetical protein
MNPTVVVNELVDARRKLDDVHENIKRAMAYADDITANELEEIRKQLVRIILDIDMIIERHIR